MSTSVLAGEAPGLLAKLRAFWAVRLLLALIPIVAYVVLLRVGTHVLHLDDAPLGRAVVRLLAGGGALALYVGYVRVVEQREITELGTTGAASELGSGFTIGAGLFSATIGILWLLGGWTLTGTGSWAAMLGQLASAISAGFLEEILFRGVLFRIIEARAGSAIALGLTAALFGVAHVFNPGASAISTVAIALEAGVLLGACYMFSRRLWLPIGTHIAWNFTQGGIFGAAVSGGSARGLLNGSFHGSDLLTGGSFGPEASLVTVLLCSTAGVAMLVLAARRGHVRWLGAQGSVESAR